MNPKRVAARMKGARILNHIGISIVAFVFSVPLLFMLLTALKPKNEVMVKPIKMFGSYLAWENITRAWEAIPFSTFLTNSVVVGILTTLLSVITSSMAAYAFARIKFPGRNYFFIAYLGTLMIPSQVMIMPLYLIMKKIAWYNTLAALIVPPAFTAFGVFLMRQFFLTIPYEIEEAAKIDGCNAFTIFFRIMLPIARPGVASLAIFSFVDSWKAFLWPLIVIGSEEYKTLPLGLYMFNGQYGTDWTALMCATAIAVVPSFLIFLLFQRNLAEGIAVTGMGGK